MLQNICEEEEATSTVEDVEEVQNPIDQAPLTEHEPVQESEPLKSLKRRATDVIEGVNELFAVCANDGPAHKVARRTVGNVDDTEQYIARLRTYTPGKWRKPRQLSPRVCASHGWCCSEMDMLKCKECGALMYVTFPLLNACTLVAFNKNVERHVSSLHSHHKAHCIWHDNKYREPLEEIEPAKMLQIFMERYGTLEPHIKKEFKCAKMTEITEQQLKTFDVECTRAMLLAICGWSYEGNRDQITCKKCQRVTSLFIFNEGKPFHPLEQHFSWCSMFDTARCYPRWKEDYINVKPKDLLSSSTSTSHLSSVVNIKLRMRQALGGIP